MMTHAVTADALVIGDTGVPEAELILRKLWKLTSTFELV